MNDTLREALEALAKELGEREEASKKAFMVGDLTHDEATLATFEDRWAINRLRAILAAHPADTETEKVVQYVVVTDRGNVFDCNFGSDSHALESAKDTAIRATEYALLDAETVTYRAAVIVEVSQ